MRPTTKTTERKARFADLSRKIAALEVAQRFGKQKVRASSSRVSSSGAHHAGREAGARINIPHGMPVCQANHARIGA